MRYQIFVYILLLAFPLNAASTASKSDPSKPDGLNFIEDGKRGWFWYEIEPEPEEESEEEPDPPLMAKPEPKKEPEKKPEGPTPLSAAWFKINLDKFRDKAIDSASDEDVKAYLYLQRVAMDKAERFKNTYMKVVMGNSDLDENSRYPESSGGGRVLDESSYTNSKEIFSLLSERVGIFFFYKNKKECPVCIPQTRALDTFARKSGIKVFPVSLDGSETDGKNFMPFKKDDGHFEKFGLKYTPAVVLAAPSQNTFQIINQGGAFDASETIEKFLKAALYIGAITEEQYRKTTPSRLPLIDASGVKEGFITEADQPGNVVDQVKTLIPESP